MTTIHTTEGAYDALRASTADLPWHHRAFGPTTGHKVEALLLRTHKGVRFIDWKGFDDEATARRWVRAWSRTVIEAVILPVPYPDA